MKRFIKALFFILISGLLISGCILNASEKLKKKPGPNRDDFQDPAAAQATLKLWHIWATDSDSNRRPFEKALDQWNAEHPETQIVTEATENETYKIKLRTAIAVNEAPDIFYGWGAGFAKPFVEAGKVLALDEYLDEEVRGRLVPGSLDNFTYNGKIYGLPTFMIAGIFYCNEDLFKKNNVDMPETYSELLEAVKAFKEKHITPITVGLKDGWPGIFYQNILAVRTAGIKKSIAALNKQESFFQQEFIESAERLGELIDLGAFDPRGAQLTQHEAELAFLNGKAAMYYGGSWAAGSMDRSDCPVKGKIVVKNFPVLEGSKGDQNGFLGGAIDTFMVSSGTSRKKEAVEAIISINEDFCRESYLTGAGIPAWKFDIRDSNISPLALEISELLESGDGFVLAWDTFLSGSEAQTHINLVAELFSKKITPEGFALNMQQLNKTQQTFSNHIAESQRR